MELGGKNPMIVRADADVDAAVTGRGPGLLLQRRPDLHRHRADLRPRAGPRRVPAPASPRRPGRSPSAPPTTTPPRSARSPLPTSSRSVEAHVADAIDHGAELVAGGKARPDLGPLFFEPTVLTGVQPTMRVVRRGDVRPGGRGLPRRRRRGRRDPRQRHRVRPVGQHLVRRPRRGPPARRPDPRRCRQHQRRLRSRRSARSRRRWAACGPAVSAAGTAPTGSCATPRRRRSRPSAAPRRTPPSPAAFLAAAGAAMKAQIAAARLRSRRSRRSS